MNALIEIRNLHYRPDSIPSEQPDILDGITLDIHAGEFVTILGENGSGKTTLIKHINGLLHPTEGTVRINGLDTRTEENLAQIRLNVGMVFQNPEDQIVASTVEEDIAFGLENLNIDTKEISSRVSEQLEIMGLSVYAHRPPYLLSGGELQKLALAGVLVRCPKVILFDEPTSMLDPVARNASLSKIRELHQQGMTVIYVTHYMEEAVYADKIIVLKDGKVISQGKPIDIFSQRQILYETGLELPEVVRMANQFRAFGWDLPSNILTPEELLLQKLPSFSGKQTQFVPKNISQCDDQVLINIQDVNYTYLANTPFEKQALNNVSLSISQEKIHGLVGINGSGKSTLLQHLNGILRPTSGEIFLKNLKLHNPDTKLKDIIEKVGLVFQNPESQFFESFVGEEIAYGPKQFKFDEVRNRVKEAMSLVGLDFEIYKDRRLTTLSGGEKRKVALASTLVLQQDILLFDEPTAGMDPASRHKMLDLFKSLRDQGKTILISTHRLDELAQISDHMSLMKTGKVLKTGHTKDIFQSNQTIKDAGLLVPLSVQISNKLVSNGWPIQNRDTSTLDKLFDVIKEFSS